MRKKSIRLSLLIGVLAIVACAAPPQLEPRSTANPEGVDLSGAWRIRVESRKTLDGESEQSQSVRMPNNPTAYRSTRNQGRVTRSEGVDVWIFIETGRALKVTQTNDGLFISFDRAIVEEFTFGENRTVSVGPIEAQRVSGWDGAELVVETMDEQGAVLTETWGLEDGGSVLVREIAVTKGDAQLFSARQVFDQR